MYERIGFHPTTLDLIVKNNNCDGLFPQDKLMLMCQIFKFNKHFLLKAFQQYQVGGIRNIE